MIPTEAFEAARKVAFERYGTKPDATYLRTVLEAAAPYMRAAAWDEGRRADDFEVSIGLDRNPYMLNNEGEK